MASSGKKKTTMAKLNRESKLRERRLDKKARKDARKLAPVDQPDGPVDPLNPTGSESGAAGAEAPALEPVADTLAGV